MARYTGAVCRLCRREGQKLFLKGDRCYSGKCSLDRRGYAPGQHGQSRKKVSDYGLQLRMKQKARRYYGVLESQFHHYFEMAERNEIYRTGVIGQFNLSFELAWKALQAVLRVHGAEGTDTGSPREILQLGYKFGFIDDASVWLLMLKKRNLSVHIYNAEEVDEMILLIRDSFLPAFIALDHMLEKKLDEADESWE